MHRRVGGHRPFVALAEPGGHRLAQELRVGPSDEFGLRAPEQPLEGSVAGEHHAGGVLQPDGVRQRLEQRLEPRAFLGERRRLAPDRRAHRLQPRQQDQQHASRDEQDVSGVTHPGCRLGLRQ